MRDRDINDVVAATFTERTDLRLCVLITTLVGFHTRGDRAARLRSSASSRTRRLWRLVTFSIPTSNECTQVRRWSAKYSRGELHVGREQVVNLSLRTGRRQ